MSQVQDSNPAYESANKGSQAIDRNTNKIDNYDYMRNQDDYEQEFLTDIWGTGTV